MSKRAAIGVDVGGTTTKGALVLESGDIAVRVEHPTDVTAATKTVIAVVDELLERAKDGDHRISGIGVGAAGFVGDSVVVFSPNLVYDDPNVGVALHARTGLPVAVDNDANAAAWGERTYGAARGSDHLTLVMLGTGVGSGFVVDGRLLRGYSGTAAELGHIVLDPSGPDCPCGLKGCAEQLLSGPAIARMGRRAAEENSSTSMVAFAGSIDDIRAEDVARAAREYDEVARDVLRRAGRSLGMLLSNVVNIFDPEVIVLGGSVTEAGEPFLGPARDELARMTLAQRRRPMRLDVSRLGDDIGLLGAAALAFDEAGS